MGLREIWKPEPIDSEDEIWVRTFSWSDRSAIDPDAVPRSLTSVVGSKALAEALVEEYGTDLYNTVICGGVEGHNNVPGADSPAGKQFIEAGDMMLRRMDEGKLPFGEPSAQG